MLHGGDYPSRTDQTHRLTRPEKGWSLDVVLDALKICVRCVPPKATLPNHREDCEQEESRASALSQTWVRRVEYCAAQSSRGEFSYCGDFIEKS